MSALRRGGAAVLWVVFGGVRVGFRRWREGVGSARVRARGRVEADGADARVRGGQPGARGASEPRVVPATHAGLSQGQTRDVTGHPVSLAP